MDKFKELIATLEAVISSREPDVEALPEGVAEPGRYSDHLKDLHGRAASELSTVAVAWALLHEIRHIRHQREGTSADPYGTDPKPKHDEEMSCDEFATTFLLDQIDAYAQYQGESSDLVRQKRQLGIYFGLFAITLLAKDKWEASDTHPAVQTRIDAIRVLIKPDKSVICRCRSSCCLQRVADTLAQSTESLLTTRGQADFHGPKRARRRSS
ncbi:hypothetical protein LAV84_28735 [Rhizobium sp. VS19-DR104.2]|uniref:phage exclusion protein Lit family protein n=1 Tax=unclassified Rhizobium TaxID=2613769 RepID=UPI001CC387A2|nr:MULTISPECIES: phage exclusion protein Lit family protein [unclassified Rhizobium]MBZ5763052.1 hypothetical protein [Rhizobium sp. VS19-DR96]MBZ5768830.1 hypothetical protein [Rhizobium sp. VS19-DR129.2]MBZ5776360.1 hypothetical protein [Rhizobium sp. VS19-DRK62.2]MBZ5787567.1 hypothetical protein [Rhizobium sp. VS19-DR121]MBZ5804922.1 hypothetical protein [Rhizobium sp. VS19-DR181]